MKIAKLLSGVFTAALVCNSCTPTTPQPNTPVSKPITNTAPELISPPEPLVLLSDDTSSHSDLNIRHTSSYALPPNLTELPATNQLRNNKSAPTTDSGSSAIAVPPVLNTPPE